MSLGLPKASILLIEAGPAASEELRINVPGLRGSILGTTYDWNFTTVEQANAAGRKIDVNRGKVLGGSSAMNYLCYDRAAAGEYDAWAKLGSAGWNWDTMIAAMTASENFTGSDADTHGYSGPIRNTYNRVVYPVLNTWQPTVSQLGVNVNDGSNMGGKPIGVMFQPTNIDVTHRTRSYSANSYLPLAGKNLVVKTDTQVAKVVFQKCGKEFQATGVELADGTIISSNKEVILSAGSIQSPGLLENSGIGQSAVLKAAGVTPVVDLPGVGENYQDHIRVSNTYRLKAGLESFDDLIYASSGANATGELQKWIDGKRSLYEYTTSAYSFLNWDQIGNSSKTQVLAAAKADVGSSMNVIDKQKLAYLQDSSIPSVEYIMEANYVGAAGYSGGNFVTIFSTVMHALSRGSVHINPADPSGKPVIDPKYLSKDHDVRAIVEAAKFARKIASTEPMNSWFEAETEPGPSVASEDDDAWKKFAVSTVNSFYHPVGTCALLPRKDGGVVDADLKVYGTSNLRVVDNSIIPVILSAHIQTAAYGIAEIAAGKIIAAAK